MRSWEMYGHEEGGTWLTVGEKEYVLLYQYETPPVPVLVVEDDDGEYMGWLNAKDESQEPVMIQHRQIFNIQFPYGYKAEVKHGKGEAIRLTIAPRADEAT